MTAYQGQCLLSGLPGTKFSLMPSMPVPRMCVGGSGNPQLSPCHAGNALIPSVWFSIFFKKETNTKSQIMQYTNPIVNK